MAKGRGSALVTCLAILYMLAIIQPAFATVYTIGGSSGWTYNVVNWARGKTLRAGDVVVFKYNKNLHNVVAVSGTGYQECSTAYGARYYQTGNDMVQLRRGANYFICSFSGHCQSNMKIAIYAI